MSRLTGYDLVPVADAMARVNRNWELAAGACDVSEMYRMELQAEMLIEEVMYPWLPKPAKEVARV